MPRKQPPLRLLRGRLERRKSSRHRPPPTLISASPPPERVAGKAGGARGGGHPRFRRGGPKDGAGHINAGIEAGARKRWRRGRRRRIWARGRWHGAGDDVQLRGRRARIRPDIVLSPPAASSILEGPGGVRWWRPCDGGGRIWRPLARSVALPAGRTTPSCQGEVGAGAPLPVRGWLREASDRGGGWARATEGGCVPSSARRQWRPPAALTGGCGRESWRRRSGVWALVVMMAAAGRALTAGSMVALAGSSRVGGVAGACGDGSRLVNPCSRGWQRHGSGLGLVARGTMWWSGNVRSAGGLCGFG